MTILHGVVTKAGAMSKTVTVTVSRKVVHPILLKEMTRHKKFLVHDESEEASLSDNVTIRLGKPHSKRKSFHLVSVDGRAASLASSDLPTTNPGEDADRPHTPGQSEVEMEAEEQRREARESQEQGATSRSSSGGRDWSEQRRRIKEAARQDALKRLGIQGA